MPVVILGYALKAVGAGTALAGGAILVTKILIDTGVIIP